MRQFKDWKIRSKLFAAFSIVVFFLTVLGGYTIFSTANITNKVRKSEARNVAGIDLCIEMKMTITEARHLFYYMMLTEDRTVFEDIEIKKEKFHILASELQELLPDKVHTEYIEDILREFDLYCAAGKKMIGDYLNKKISGEKITPQGDAGMLFDKLHAYMDDLLDENAAFLSLSLGGIYTVAGNAQKVNSVLTVLAILLTVLFLFIFTKMMTASLHELIKGTRVISQGDFSYKVKVSGADEYGELAESFNRMSANLQKITVSRDSLAQEVAMRREAQEKMAALMKDMENKNREVENYAHIISHDMKEPLRALNAYSNFLLSECYDGLSSKGQGYLKRIESNVIWMQQTVDRFIEVLSIDKKRYLMAREEVPRIVVKTVMRLLPVIERKNALVTMDNPLPEIICDSQGIEDVFTQLISNALQFSDKSPLKIGIGYREHEQYHEFYVKDNGPGIEKQYFDKIFKLFQRLVKREESKGPGAGLAIAKKIIQRHKGDIRVESEIGQGATFYFTIAKSLQPGVLVETDQEIIEAVKKLPSSGGHYQADFVQDIIDSMEYVLYILNPDYTIAMVNEAARRQGLYEGGLCYKLTHHLDAPCAGDHLCPLKEVVNSRQRVTCEHVHRDRSGAEAIFEVYGSPVFDDDGNVVQIIEYACNVTQRRREEEIRQRYMFQLENINKEFDDFTHAVSHGLNKPLQTIHFFTQIVIDEYKEELGEVGKNYLFRILADIDRMERLLRNFLTAARAGTRKYVFEELNIKEIIEETITSLDYAVREKNVQVVMATHMPIIWCDRAAIAEVFTVMILNGIRYSDKPQPRVEIGCAEKDAYHEFYVKDNGFGMEEHCLQSVFRLFQGFTDEKGTKGSGVSLVVVKKIIERHNGSVWAQSKVGKGTTFYFKIPKDKQNVIGNMKISEVLVERHAEDKDRQGEGEFKK